MKKLIMLASVAMLSCAATAASFTWGFSSGSIRAFDGEYLEGGTALLYLGTVTASDTAFSLSSGAKLLASAGQNQNTYKFGDLTTPIAGDLDSDAAGQAFTLILLEKSDVSNLAGYEGHYIIAPGTSGQATDPMGETTWATFTNGTAFVAGDWQSMTASVPEPTSGLLLLIGMAGLALKRKRA